MTEEEIADLVDAEDVCRRFLDWDLDKRETIDVKQKLQWVLSGEEGDGNCDLNPCSQ